MSLVASQQASLGVSESGGKGSLSGVPLFSSLGLASPRSVALSRKRLPTPPEVTGLWLTGRCGLWHPRVRRRDS